VNDYDAAIHLLMKQICYYHIFKYFTFQGVLNLENKEESHGFMSGVYGGWCFCEVWCLAKNWAEYSSA